MMKNAGKKPKEKKPDNLPKKIAPFSVMTCGAVLSVIVINSQKQLTFFSEWYKIVVYLLFILKGKIDDEKNT